MKSILFVFSLLISTIAFSQTWYEIESNVSSRLTSIHFPTADVGYIVGEDSLILKTTNGGRTWQRMPITGINFRNGISGFRHVEFTDENVGVVVLASMSPTDLIYRTFDGGNTWSWETRVFMCIPKITYSFDSANIVVAGAGCFSPSTTERILNSVSQGPKNVNPTFHADTLIAIDFLNQNFGMVAGTSKFIFITNDGGLSWDTASIGFDSLKITDIEIMNDTLAYATYAQTGFTGALASRDGGRTWNDDPDLFSFFMPGFNAVEQTDRGQLFFGGRTAQGTGIMQHKVAGFWRFDAVDQAIQDITTIGDSIVFGVGDSGYIITNQPKIFNSIQSLKGSLNARIFPNPSSQVIFVEHDDEEIFNFQIVDINGRILNTDFKQNKNQIVINTLNLPNGIYFLRLLSDSQARTEKIIIQH